jgi:hypothetical protein
MSTREMCTFNVKDGYAGAPIAPRATHAPGPALPPSPPGRPAALGAEAIVRGYKLGLLTPADYNNLSQCETLDDIKLYLVSLMSDRRRRAGAGARALPPSHYCGPPRASLQRHHTSEAARVALGPP